MTNEANHHTIKELVIMLGAAFVLVLGLPLLEVFVTFNDELLTLVGSWVFVFAALAVPILAPLIVYRLLFRSNPWVRITTAIAVSVVAFFVALPGSLYVSNVLCSAWENQCVLPRSKAD